MFTDCINVMDSGNRFQAFIPSKPQYCGYGNTKAEAIGKLVIQLQNYKILDLSSNCTEEFYRKQGEWHRTTRTESTF